MNVMKKRGMTPGTGVVILIVITAACVAFIGAYTANLFIQSRDLCDCTVTNSNYSGIVQGYANQIYYKSDSNFSVLILSIESPCPGNSSSFLIISRGASLAQSVKLGDVISANYSLFEFNSPNGLVCGYNTTSWIDLSK